jgi:hypothetical protein
MSATINFRNNVQAVLFQVELSGQISDGMWENARPYDHWQPWCGAEVRVNPCNMGINFYPRKNNYNFTSKELLDCVGDRMVWACNLAEKGYDAATVRDFYDVVDMTHYPANDYWNGKRALLLEKFGSYENLIKERENGSYDLKKLKAELRDMKTIIRQTLK